MSDPRVITNDNELNTLIPTMVAIFYGGLERVRELPEPLSNADHAELLTELVGLIQRVGTYCDGLLARIEGLEQQVASITDDVVRLAKRR